MQAQIQDLETLLLVQEIDQNISHLEKKLDSLPERDIILAARKKRDVISEKLEKAKKIQNDVTKKIQHIDDEDSSLEKKENGVQAAIDATNGDYRNIEARTKELNGIYKRRTTLSENRQAAQDELDKINKLIDEIVKLQEENDLQETQATESFKLQGTSLKDEIAASNSKRESLLLSIDPQIAKVYNETLNQVGTVAIGRLDGSNCGVCRTRIEGGRLIDLKSAAPLGFCPSCKRMLIIGETDPE